MSVTGFSETAYDQGVVPGVLSELTEDLIKTKALAISVLEQLLREKIKSSIAQKPQRLRRCAATSSV